MRWRGGWFLLQRPGCRAVLWRVAAVLLGCVPLLAAELVCRQLGVGAASAESDPFVGFAGSRPLFELSGDGSEYRVSAARLNFFRPAKFAARKPPGTRRIFVLGGSTVQGHPFATETAFPRLLQCCLERLDPRRRWEVINCGGVSYASYRLLPVLQEVLQYEPDVCVFCEGQNEFLEDIAYGSRRGVTESVGPLLSVLLRLQCVRAVLGLTGAAAVAADERPLLPAEVLTRLDQSDGLARFHRDDLHAAQVERHFEHSVERMVQLCGARGVPLVLVQPPVNLSDCPPFKSEFSVSAEQQAEVLELLRRARAEAASDRAGAVRLAERAVRLDDRCALAWYELGQLQLTCGDFESARLSLRRAADEDVCPLRMTTGLQRGLQRVAAERGVLLLNADELLAGRCRGGIVSEQVLVDHVHPSFGGHEDMAVALAELLVSAGLAGPAAADWQEAARADCRAVVQGLDDQYFLRGRRTLRALQQWAAGRALEPELVE